MIPRATTAALASFVQDSIQRQETTVTCSTPRMRSPSASIGAGAKPCSSSVFCTARSTPYRIPTKDSLRSESDRESPPMLLSRLEQDPEVLRDPRIAAFSGGRERRGVAPTVAARGR